VWTCLYDIRADVWLLWILVFIVRSEIEKYKVCDHLDQAKSPTMNRKQECHMPAIYNQKLSHVT